MSQLRETRLFDIVVLILFVFIVGWFAMRSMAPVSSSIPGVQWPSAPAPKILEESKVIVEGQPLAPETDTNAIVEPAPMTDTPAEEGAWE